MRSEMTLATVSAFLVVEGKSHGDERTTTELGLPTETVEGRFSASLLVVVE